MNILLTNDDGVFAPGLWALFQALRELGRVTVIAPGTEQSGIGHAITYREGIRAERVMLNGRLGGYSITGTPADCVKFGLLALLEEPQDLVVSGINLGLNLGCNIFYSGTVAAALEGAMNGIPSVAFSTIEGNAGCLDQTADHAVRTLKLILGNGNGPPGALAFNVNIPFLGEGEPEILFTRHRAEPFTERYVEVDERSGGRSYRLDLAPDGSDDEPQDCDVRAVERGMISVTPLRANLTDVGSLRLLAPSERHRDARGNDCRR